VTEPLRPFQASSDPDRDIRDFLQTHKIHIPLTAFAKPGSTQEDEPAEEKGDFNIDFDLKPREVKQHLDRFVIGQEEAKKALSIAVCDHYNYVRQLREGNPLSNYLKQNVLLLGSTGVGKTYLIRCLAELIGVPFVKADATKFSETGYVGQDVDELVRALVQQAGGDVALAECGIIYLDEVDKIAASPQTAGRDVSGRGVQTNLLKLLEETEVPLRSSNDLQGQLEAAMEAAQGRKSKPKTINTKTILFIASGAFAHLPEIIRHRLRSGSMGFKTSDNVPDAAPELLAQLGTKDLIEAGFEPEFVGRLPVRVFCRDLSIEDLVKILTQSEGSIFHQFKAAFKSYGIEIEFKPEAIQWVAERAHEEGTGARGLVSVLERLLRDLKFELPSTVMRKVVIDQAFVEATAQRLKEILGEARKLDFEQHAAVLEEVLKTFTTRHRLTVRFTPKAAQELVRLAAQSDKPLREFCQDHLKDFPYGLKLISSNTGVSEFTLDIDTIREPHKTLSDWVLKSYREKSTPPSS
jgi:ATP-dependent Clp protease ATP-binding subunit ClpX